MHPDIVNYTYYQKFLQMISEEHSKRNRSKKTPPYAYKKASPAKINEENEDDDDEAEAEDTCCGRQHSDSSSESSDERDKQIQESRISRAVASTSSSSSTPQKRISEHLPTTSGYAICSSQMSKHQDDALPQIVLPSTQLIECETDEDTEKDTLVVDEATNILLGIKDRHNSASNDDQKEKVETIGV